MERSLIETYRRERRALEIPNFRREDLGTVVRYTPTNPTAEGIVCFTSVAASDLAQEIERHIAHFRSLEAGFEWKVYDSDDPASLRMRLLQAGFEEGEAETLMVRDPKEIEPDEKAADDGVTVARIEAEALLEGIVELQERVWNRSFGWLLDGLREMWHRASFYAAYQHELLVGAGWIEYPQGSQFAELHGGAVLPGYRGRGIYSRLWRIRMIDARERGVRWVAVDAGPMSRPILEAKGFRGLDGTYPMKWSNDITKFRRQRI